METKKRGWKLIQHQCRYNAQTGNREYFGVWKCKESGRMRTRPATGDERLGTVVEALPL